MTTTGSAQACCSGGWVMLEHERKLVRQALSRWGAHVAPWDDPQSGACLPTPVHVLHRARLYAPGTRDRAMRRIAGRDGYTRRLIVGGGEIAATWAIDPIRCTETRPRTYTLPNAHAVPAIDLPEELKPLDRAIGRMERVPQCVIRTEYTVRERQKVKAAIAGHESGSPMTLRQYRHHLSEAVSHLASVIGRGLQSDGTA